MSVTCEIIDLQQESTKDYPWATGRLPAVKGCFAPSHSSVFHVDSVDFVESLHFLNVTVFSSKK